MARPLRVEFPGALYLVTARALARHKLYRDAAEAEDFVGRLPALQEGFGVRCHGYCLLPNHYHLLLETPRANLSRALHRLNAGYTATTNARRRRKGPLLQSRYRALVIDEQPWLLRLSVHLHLNPLRRKLATRPEQYPWSSAGAFLAPDAPPPWLATSRVLGLAGGQEAYRSLLAEAVEMPPKAPWSQVWRQTVLGGDRLRQRVLALVAERDPREIPGFSSPRSGGLSLDAVVGAVAEYTGVAAENVYRGKFQRVLARKLALYLARRFTGLTLREIGAAFGVDYTTVHMAARRVEDLRGEKETVDELLNEIEAALREGSAESSAAPPPFPEAVPPEVEPAFTSAPEPAPADPVPAPEPALPDAETAPPENPPRPSRKRGKAKKDSPQLKLF
ncbi:MAG: helix-turn-helix domain-containing protein [Deferrisomatales bacterium]|nr:helix-turn-helix domain-containing protein [Deferrisomatales bacterium]